MNNDTGRGGITPQKGRNMCKQYFIMFESDRVVCGSNDHLLCNASTIRSAKAAIRSARKKYYNDEYKPRNFRVYDSWADVDPATEFVPCVYQED